MIPWLVVQGVVFAAWVVLVFRTLFRLLALLQERTGHMLPSLRDGLVAPLMFLREPQFQRDRQMLGALTLVLLVLSAGFATSR